MVRCMQQVLCPKGGHSGWHHLVLVYSVTAGPLAHTGRGMRGEQRWNPVSNPGGTGCPRARGSEPKTQIPASILFPPLSRTWSRRKICSRLNFSLCKMETQALLSPLFQGCHGEIRRDTHYLGKRNYEYSCRPSLRTTLAATAHQVTCGQLCTL